MTDGAVDFMMKDTGRAATKSERRRRASSACKEHAVCREARSLRRGQ